MGSSSLRKGLGNWDAAKDAAMAAGLGSSLELVAEETFNDRDQSGTLAFLSHTMRLQPRSEEAGVLDKLTTQINKLMLHAYGDIDQVVAHFYDQLQEFNKMEPVELERAILQIQKVIYLATDTVSSLYNDAYFADRVQQDEYWAAYRGLAPEETEDGSARPSGKVTIGDRQAYAYAKTRDSRFYYYYRYLVWRRLSEKLSALRDLQKTLEWFRSRSIKDKPW